MVEYKILNINELNIDEISKKVSKQRIERSERYKFEADRKRSIAVEYLLNLMIDEFCKEIETPVVLSYDEHGKPHIYKDTADDACFFSISHSGDYVACILADSPCGIDIEKHSERDYEKIAKRICTEDKLLNIKNKNDFYDIWTIKESALKAVGLGLALDMREIRTAEVKENQDTKEYIIYIKGEKYSGSIVSAPEGYSLSYVFKD